MCRLCLRNRLTCCGGGSNRAQNGRTIGHLSFQSRRSCPLSSTANGHVSHSIDLSSLVLKRKDCRHLPRRTSLPCCVESLSTLLAFHRRQKSKRSSWLTPRPTRTKSRSIVY